MQPPGGDGARGRGGHGGDESCPQPVHASTAQSQDGPMTLGPDSMDDVEESPQDDADRDAEGPEDGAPEAPHEAEKEILRHHDGSHPWAREVPIAKRAHARVPPKVYGSVKS